MGQITHNRKGMEEYRRELRKTPTPAEVLLWERLRSSQLDGRKFRRQHSIGVYILDFYCPTERLCVKVDGSVHKTAGATVHDEIRDATLAQLDIKTLRISNREVEEDIVAVLQRIRNCFQR
ncbi:endonuclease domain-containing protein [Spirosoma aerophilum]